MATRTDYLRIKFESDGQGNVKASLGGVEQSLNSVDAAARRANASMVKGSGDSERSLLSLGKSVGAAAVAFGALEALSFFKNAVFESQKLNAQLVTVTGNQARANAEFAKLRDFAASTPFEVGEVVNAFVKLQALGIKPTIALLTSLGNTASAMGKTLDQSIEAVADAATGEFERLKEFGIKTKQAGEDVVFTFQGVETKVKKNADAIVGYLQTIGETKFAGGMAREAATAEGQLSNLTDGLKRFAVAIGDIGITQGASALITLLAKIANGAAEALEGLNSLRNDAVEGLPDLFNQVRNAVGAGANAAPFVAYYGNLDNREDPTAGAGAAAAAAATQTDTLTAAQKRLITQLERLAQTYGISRAETLEYEKASAVAKATTDAQREALTKAYDAAIKSVRAQDTLTDSTKAGTKADRDAEKAKRDKIRVQEQQARADDQFAAEFNTLIDMLDPAAAKTNEYAKAQDTLATAFLTGAKTASGMVMTLADYEAALDKLDKKHLEDIFGKEGTEAWRDVAKDQVKVYSDVWTDGADALGSTIQDALLGRFRNTTDGISELARRLFDTLNKGGSSQAFNIRTASALYGRSFENDPRFTGPAFAQGGTEQAPNSNFGGTNAVGIITSALPILARALGGGGNMVAGAAAGAQLGGQIGGGYGAIIGAIAGGLFGGISDNNNVPTVRITGSAQAAAQERQGRTVFGTVGVTTSNTDLRSGQVIDQLRRLDALIASMLTTAERSAATSALTSFGASDTRGIDLETLIARRLGVIIQAVEPAFAPFLNAITDVEERVKQFTAIRELKKQLEDFDQIIAAVAGGPLEQLAAQIHALDKAVDETRTALSAAIDAQDPAAVQQAADAATQAITNWASQTIAAAEKVEASLQQLDAQSRAFAVNIATRLANVSGGGQGAVLGILGGNIATLRGNIGTARTPEQGMQYLNEFITTVDTWLQTSRAEIQRLLAEQMAALDLEQNTILADAQARANAAQAAAQYAAQAEADRNEALRAALQEQLQLAQEWLGTVDQTQALLDRLRYTSANPLGEQARFAALGGEADALYSQFQGGTGPGRVDVANRLLQILQQQLDAGQNLLQRPSPEAFAAYNQILARINAVRDVAKPEADRALELQQQLNDLQSATTSAVYGVSDAMYYLSGAERARLDEIEAERLRLQAEAQEKLDAIDEEARGYYEYAQAEGERLQTEQRDLLQQQLDAITGGMDVQTFIAQTQAQARDLLGQIRDDLRAFLTAISIVGGVVGGANGPPGTTPGGPIVGDPVIRNSVGGVTLNFSDGAFVFNGGDAQANRREMDAWARDTLPQLASRVKRELKTA